MVAALERIPSRHLKKWLGVPPSFTSIGLYGKTNKLQLPLSSLVEEFKVAKSRLVLTLRDSPDQLIRDAGIETRTSRKWSATEAVKQAENTLKHKDIVGVTAVGHQGIGATNTVLWSRSDQKERKALIQSEVRRAEEHARQARAVEMGAQGAWTTWNTTDRKLTWGDIWKYEPLKFSFLLRSVYNLLPSPANLCRWGLTRDPKCSLCEKPGTLEHVLSSCSTALTQGRNRWRHDSVLRELADWLEKERKKEHGNNPKHGQIAFVKSGDTRKTQTAQPTLQNRSVGSSTAKSTLQNRSVGSSILGGTLAGTLELTWERDLFSQMLSKLDLMFMKHYAPNRCLYIKVAKLRTGVGSAETSYLQNCSVKLFKEHFKVQICKGRLFEKNKIFFFLIFTN